MWGEERGTDRDYEELRVPSGFPGLWLGSTTSLSSSLSTYWMDQYGDSGWPPWLPSTHFIPCLPGRFNSFQPILRLTQGDKGYCDGHKGESVSGSLREHPGGSLRLRRRLSQERWSDSPESTQRMSTTQRGWSVTKGLRLFTVPKWTRPSVWLLPWNLRKKGDKIISISCSPSTLCPRHIFVQDTYALFSSP